MSNCGLAALNLSTYTTADIFDNTGYTNDDNKNVAEKN